MKNPNFGGVDDIQKIFNTIKDKYDMVVYINTIPEYYVSITSENEKQNIDLVNKIEQEIKLLTGEMKCLYKKDDIITTNNL